MKTRVRNLDTAYKSLLTSCSRKNGVKITSKNNNLSERKIQYLRQHLLKCEERIIEVANWDTNYFYDGLLTDRQRNMLIKLLEKRRRYLNQMYIGTNGEQERLGELNISLCNATQQMYMDLRNIHEQRKHISTMSQYDSDTWLLVKMSYNYYGDHSVRTMPEDGYYSSLFDSMLNLLCVEEKNITYKGCRWFTAQLADPIPSLHIKKEDYLRPCNALTDMLNNHLYSIPDVLRMNCFRIELKIEQSMNFNIANI